MGTYILVFSGKYENEANTRFTRVAVQITEKIPK